MKKALIIVLITFTCVFIYPLSVFAGGDSDDVVQRGQSDHICYYEKEYIDKTYRVLFRFTILPENPHITASSPNFEIEYKVQGSGIKATLWEVNGYNNESNNFVIGDYIYNIENDYSTYFSLSNHIFNVYENNKTAEELKAAEEAGEFCPKSIYITYDSVNKKYNSMLCDGYNSDVEVNTCNKVNQYIWSNLSIFAPSKNLTLVKLDFTLNSSFSNTGQEEADEPDIQEEYSEIKDEIIDHCDEESPNYDPDLCEIYEDIEDSNIDRGDDMGITEEMFEYYYQNVWQEMDLTLKPEALDCNSLLGVTTPSLRQPAFYLQTIFTVMKYVAIIIIIVYTIIDFVGVIISQDSDAMKKTISKATKRLILCIILFILPTILKFILQLMDIYSPDTCGIS